MQTCQDQTKTCGVFGLNTRLGPLQKEPLQALVLESLDQGSSVTRNGTGYKTPNAHYSPLYTSEREGGGATSSRDKARAIAPRRRDAMSFGVATARGACPRHDARHATRLAHL
jgi:hypothetical protein